ncbi:hypothetical protein ACH4OX_00580 [Streptomyces roseolus]|uniref:hypothetical protein n=1 Tax=Streptomyces roseolus TaxID=67358 RepID=UPI0037AD5BBA
MRPRSAGAVPTRVTAPQEVLYSLRLDGFGALVYVLEGGRVVLPSRTLPRFPDVAAVLDGGLCAYRQGRISFTSLLRSHADRVRGGVPVSYIAFDLLAVPGRDVRALPLQRVPVTEDEETARGWFRDLRRAGGEGIVAKRLDSAYRSGSTWCWRKGRHTETVDAELVRLVGPAVRPRRCWCGSRQADPADHAPAHPGPPRRGPGRTPSRSPPGAAAWPRPRIPSTGRCRGSPGW